MYWEGMGLSKALMVSKSQWAADLLDEAIAVSFYSLFVSRVIFLWNAYWMYCYLVTPYLLPINYGEG